MDEMVKATGLTTPELSRLLTSKDVKLWALDVQKTIIPPTKGILSDGTIIEKGPGKRYGERARVRLGRRPSLYEPSKPLFMQVLETILQPDEDEHIAKLFKQADELFEQKTGFHRQLNEVLSKPHYVECVVSYVVLRYLNLFSSEDFRTIIDFLAEEYDYVLENMKRSSLPFTTRARDLCYALHSFVRSVGSSGWCENIFNRWLERYWASLKSIEVWTRFSFYPSEYMIAL